MFQYIKWIHLCTVCFLQEPLFSSCTNFLLWHMATLFLLIYCLKEGKGEVLSGASFVLFYHNRSYFTQVKEPMFGFWLLLNIFISIMYSRARYITRWWICRPIGPTVRRTWTWTPFIIWTVYASTVTGWPYKYFGYPGVNVGLGTVSSSPWMG